MRMNHRHTCGFALSIALLLATAGHALLQAQQAQTLPPSTNPTNRVIYPSEGQDEQQQMADQLECYRWWSAGRARHRCDRRGCWERRGDRRRRRRCGRRIEVAARPTAGAGRFPGGRGRLQ